MTKHNLPIWRIDNLVAFSVSVIASIFAFATLYFGLSTQIQLLTQKVDIMNKNQEIILQKLVSVEARYGELALKVQALETLQGIK
ncbi:MAG: hypothetical protein UT24_C0016G0057 [Candidatus Woesebacteria bacterium GW2011_GWB1_39_12]|uniref:Uncharacterized protein n=1 Tax=Candidatus Woesebacteria bacterium GW2011_GWB1_39_12 TaxID=1618574 RepID=A0A0G0MAG5_9BACT|nr:MAG: hypothetical protein UT24_C0016G0057 [Candidatus Woesebacteria bacterium GW2011_GWB1_39_12]